MRHIIFLRCVFIRCTHCVISILTCMQTQWNWGKIKYMRACMCTDGQIQANFISTTSSVYSQIVTLNSNRRYVRWFPSHARGLTHICYVHDKSSEILSKSSFYGANVDHSIYYSVTFGMRGRKMPKRAVCTSNHRCMDKMNWGKQTHIKNEHKTHIGTSAA